jgi:hypothetical protein
MDYLLIIKKRWGDRYPRPTIDCPDCGGKLTVCWGKKVVDPYSKHTAKSNAGCTPTGESVVHSLAKRTLCEYLNTDGKVIVNTRQEVPMSLQWKTEVSHNKRKWYRHRTTNIKHRTVPWVEVKASTVIRLLVGVTNPPASIRLKDYKQVVSDVKLDSVPPRIYIDCEIQEQTNPIEEWRVCTRCEQPSIPSTSPVSVVMCSDCRTKLNLQERDNANKRAGLRQCFHCQRHDVNPNRPQYYNLCAPCQNSCSKQQIEAAKAAAGWRQCSQCQLHDIRPPWLSYCDLCIGCQSQQQTQAARLEVGCKQCDKCLRYNIELHQSDSRCAQCQQLCHKPECTERGAYLYMSKKYCSIHEPETRRQVPTPTRVPRSKPDYLKDGDETNCNTAVKEQCPIGRPSA